MKNSFNSVFPFIIVTAFLFYWISIIVLAMPPNPLKKIITGKAPRFRTMFSNQWKLFAPPQTFNYRLYYIVKGISKKNETDTIEVLADISRQKQLNAPFNQEENIIDHLLQNNVIGLITTIWGNKNIQVQNLTAPNDSAYVAHTVAQVKEAKNYTRYLSALNNYCGIILHKKSIRTAGKEVKIVITQKMIRPFKEMTDNHILQKETLVFETPFQPLSP